MANFVVGLTGGIGSGKSTIAQLFQALNISIVDADVIAREVVQPNSKALQAITQRFGQNILLPSGELNRAALRKRIFAHAEEKHWLNNLLHPLIRETMIEQLSRANSEYVILVAPLLLENKMEVLVNRVLVIDVPITIQIERTCLRDNNTVEQVQAIIKSQISRSDRLAAADDVIDNSGNDFSVIKQKVLTLHQQYLVLASKS